MSEYRFTLSCIPPKTTAQQKRAVVLPRGKGIRFFKSSKAKGDESTIAALLLPHRPAEPYRTPVSLSIRWTWPWRASESKKRRALWCAPMTAKPDLDNLSKAFVDQLVKLRFIEDDAGVVDLRLCKRWGDVPGIEVTIAVYAEDTK